MAERFAFTIEERHQNTIVEIECSEFYNRMLENGDTEYLLHTFNEVISMLSQRIRKCECDKKFTDIEADKLALVLGLIEDE